MRKNNNRKEEMFLAFEVWKESKLSQSKFCNREGLSYHTFKYWYKKYKFENSQNIKSRNNDLRTFILVHLCSESRKVNEEQGQFDVIFLNGIQLSCPVNIDLQKLKILLGI